MAQDQDIATIKIHPAIGVARLGNSTAESAGSREASFFIGPEKLWERPAPPGGFKDTKGRVKRQAARFRLFGYDRNGRVVKEITAADAEITWSAHLANRKGKRNNAGTDEQLVIDAKKQSVTPATGQTSAVVPCTGSITIQGNTATVPLGEISTDAAGRLLVLGGAGRSDTLTGSSITGYLDNPGWYDDTSDGPVTATVTLRQSGATPTVLGAWVIVGPPKFAPDLEHVISLYDRVFDQVAVKEGWLTPPARPSYAQDIYPVLERAKHTKWVNEAVTAGGFNPHGWAHPVKGGQALSKKIFARLAPPSGGASEPGPDADPNMPRLFGDDGTLTATQYGLMKKWSDGDCDYPDPWRVPSPAAEVTPADMDRAALTECVGGAFYPGIEAGGGAAWPIVEAGNYIGQNEPMRLRPTLAPGTITAYLAVPWQADFFACTGGPSVPTWWPVNRPDYVIPKGQETYVAWDRGTGSYEGMVHNWHSLGFVVKDGDAYHEVGHRSLPKVRLRSTNLAFGDVPLGVGGIPATKKLEMVFEVSTSPAPLTLAVSGLPHSTNLKVTPVSATVPANPHLEPRLATFVVTYTTGAVNSTVTDRVVVSDAENGRQWTVPITARTVAHPSTLLAVTLDGTDGAELVEAGDVLRRLLQSSPDVSLGDPAQARPGPLLPVDFAVATVTDGERSYAIGIGPPEELDTRRLHAESGNSGGYLMLAGSQHEPFAVRRQMLQVLAEATDAGVVLDADSVALDGAAQAIPFDLSDLDNAVDVVLLADDPHALEFRLQTPHGLLVEPGRSGEAGITWAAAEGVAHYRLVLPLELVPGRPVHAGTWRVLVTPGAPRTKAAGSRAAAPRKSGPQPYAVAVHSRSGPALHASAEQAGHDVGTRVQVFANVTDGGLAAPGYAVWAEITRPDGTTGTVAMADEHDGRFVGSFPTSTPGVYQVRVRAEGRSPAGYPVQREKRLTAAVWRGADQQRGPAARTSTAGTTTAGTTTGTPKPATSARPARR